MVCSLVAQFRVGNIKGVLEMQPGVPWVEVLRMIERWAGQEHRAIGAGKRTLAKCIFQGTVKDLITKFHWADAVDGRIGRLHIVVWSPDEYPLTKLRKVIMDAAGLEIRRVGELTYAGPSCDGHTWNVHECVARWTLSKSLFPASPFESMLVRPKWVSIKQLTPIQLEILRPAFDRFMRYNRELLKGIGWQELVEKGEIFVAERIALHVYLFASQPHGGPIREMTITAHSATPQP